MAKLAANLKRLVCDMLGDRVDLGEQGLEEEVILDELLPVFLEFACLAHGHQEVLPALVVDL